MPAPKKSKAPLIIAISVILLLVITAVVLLFVFKPWDSGDDSSGNATITSSATNATKEFVNAMANHDQEKFLNSLYPALVKTYESYGNSRAEIYRDMYEDAVGGENPDNVKISNIKVNNETKCSESELAEYNNKISYYEGYVEITAMYEVTGSMIFSLYDEYSVSYVDYDCSFTTIVGYCNGKYYICNFEFHE